MGRQFQVYLLPSDALSLVELLQKEVGLRLLSTRSQKPHPIVVESPIRSEAGFIRIDCLLAPNDSASIKFNHLEQLNQWNINTLLSEVIEFSGCHFDNSTLKRGRFFYDVGFYAAKQWERKAPDFLLWAESIFKVTKRFLSRVPKLDAYLGADAKLWHSTGGIFVELSIKGADGISRAKIVE